ncbi:MAG: hypothetical protein IBX55_01205 [Methyloprofundus sp.]|nr:hypothetical protein [Methyloprofundus sp.]
MSRREQILLIVFFVFLFSYAFYIFSDYYLSEKRNHDLSMSKIYEIRSFLLDAKIKIKSPDSIEAKEVYTSSSLGEIFFYLELLERSKHEIVEFNILSSDNQHYRLTVKALETNY